MKPETEYMYTNIAVVLAVFLAIVLAIWWVL